MDWPTLEEIARIAPVTLIVLGIQAATLWGIKYVLEHFGGKRKRKNKK